VPSVNTMVETEFNRIAPAAYSIHSSRVMFPRHSVDRYRIFLNDLPREIEKLAHASVEAIALACTMAGLYEGYDSDRRLAETIRKHSGVPATTTITSVIEALRQLGMRSVTVVTPYDDAENGLEKQFLEASGFKVPHISSIDRKGLNIPEVPSKLVYKAALQVGRSESDGMFISCTGLTTVDILAQLEQRLKKPVVSSNQATFWNLVRLAGGRLKLDPARFGSLMANS